MFFLLRQKNKRTWFSCSPNLLKKREQINHYNLVNFSKFNN